MKPSWIALLIALAMAPQAAAQAMNPSTDEGFQERRKAAEDVLLANQIEELRVRFRNSVAEAQRAYDRGDYAQARSLWRAAADAGYPPAQYHLAIMCERGEGGPADEAMAARWLAAAANLDYGPAEFGLASAYLAGRGVPHDDAKAVKWLRLAAGRGVPQAAYNLGVLYENGQGVEKDPKAAAEWYRKAAGRMK